MNSFLLASQSFKAENGNYYFSNGFSEALIYALLGFVIVFAGIVIIILVIWLIGLLMRKTDNLAFLGKIGKNRKKPPEKTAEQAEPTVPEADGDVPDEVKAAIIAAIMAYYRESAPKCEFRVKRIKRI